MEFFIKLHTIKYQDGPRKPFIFKNFLSLCESFSQCGVPTFLYYCTKYHCGTYSKILNTICLPKRPRKTGQTQIRLLLKKSDKGLPCLLFRQEICEFQLLFKNRKKKVFDILECLPYPFTCRACKDLS